MARPLDPFDDQVVEVADYRSEIEAAGLDPEPFLARATVLKYAFLVPTLRPRPATSRGPASSGTSRSSST